MCSLEELDSRFEQLELIDEDEDFRVVQSILSIMELQPQVVERIANVLRYEVNCGISGDEAERALTVLPMIQTFQTEVPDGSESGLYLGVDLGGTNFRIIMADLHDSKQEFVTAVETIPQELFSSSCRKLYDYMAAKLADFLEGRGLKELQFKLGYTFSFPAVMKGMKIAKLMTWTKGFHCPDGVGEDAGQLFQDAINKRGDLNIELVCVMNDTTATLLAGAFLDNQCAIGVILGTGSNAAYYEDLSRMKWFVDKHYPYPNRSMPPHQMIIDTEWGSFGDNGSLQFLKTPFDEQVDENSHHVGSYTFEKMFSGLYYGELVRVILHHLAERKLFLRGPGGGPERIPKPWKVKTVDVSAVNCDPVEGIYPNTYMALEKMGLFKYCIGDDLRVMHHVCQTVTYRAANIVAAAVSTLVRHVDRHEVVVAFDGSMYKHLPGFSRHIEERLVALCPNKKVRLVMVHDGSGRGGALGAAIANRYWQRLRDLIPTAYVEEDKKKRIVLRATSTSISEDNFEEIKEIKFENKKKKRVALRTNSENV